MVDLEALEDKDTLVVRGEKALEITGIWRKGVWAKWKEEEKRWDFGAKESLVVVFRRWQVTDIGTDLRHC